jgi:hypothetical protein
MASLECENSLILLSIEPSSRIWGVQVSYITYVFYFDFCRCMVWYECFVPLLCQEH